MGFNKSTLLNVCNHLLASPSSTEKRWNMEPPTWITPRNHAIKRLTYSPQKNYGISGDHPQELLQKHQDVITPEYPHRPCVIISGDLHCVLQDPTGFSIAPFLPHYASHRTSKDQTQSMHCPGQLTHRPVPHQALAKALTDCKIRSPDPPPKPWRSYAW